MSWEPRRCRSHAPERLRGPSPCTEHALAWEITEILGTSCSHRVTKPSVRSPFWISLLCLFHPLIPLASAILGMPADVLASCGLNWAGPSLGHLWKNHHGRTTKGTTQQLPGQNMAEQSRPLFPGLCFRAHPCFAVAIWRLPSILLTAIARALDTRPAEEAARFELPSHRVVHRGISSTKAAGPPARPSPSSWHSSKAQASAHAQIDKALRAERSRRSLCPRWQQVVKPRASTFNEAGWTATPIPAARGRV